MKTNAVLLVILMVVSLTRGQVASELPFTLFYPLDESVVTGGGLIHLVVDVEPGAQIVVRVNGLLTTDVKIEGRVHHYPISLRFGANSITVEGSEGKTGVRTEQRQVFFFSPIAEEKRIPREFSTKPFHQAGLEAPRCSSCHELEPQEIDFRPSSGKDSSCHSCHKDLIEYRNVHGPASVWNCLKCHDAESKPVRYETPRPVRELCFGCHETLRDYFFSAPYQHGPTATGMCTICHNPHASDNEYWLKKEPWDLCTTCHLEKASGRHVIAWGPEGDSHPTRSRPDPTNPAREFSCRSCHNPHASNAPKLWNFKVTAYYQLCWTCHQK